MEGTAAAVAEAKRADELKQNLAAEQQRASEASAAAAVGGSVAAEGAGAAASIAEALEAQRTLLADAASAWVAAAMAVSDSSAAAAAAAATAAAAAAATAAAAASAGAGASADEMETLKQKVASLEKAHDEKVTGSPLTTSSFADVLVCEITRRMTRMLAHAVAHARPVTQVRRSPL